MVSQIPWKGEFLFKNLESSAVCNFRTSCNKFLSSSLISEGVTNLAKSNFSTLPTNAVPSSFTSPLTTLNPICGYSVSRCCNTKPKRSRMATSFSSSITSPSSISQSLDLFTGLLKTGAGVGEASIFFIFSSSTFRKGFPS